MTNTKSIGISSLVAVVLLFYIWNRRRQPQDTSSLSVTTAVVQATNSKSNSAEHSAFNKTTQPGELLPNPPAFKDTNTVISVENGLAMLERAAAELECSRSQIAIDESHGEKRIQGWWLPRPTLREVERLSNRGAELAKNISPQEADTFNKRVLRTISEFTDYKSDFKILVFASSRGTVNAVYLGESNSPGRVELDETGTIRGCDTGHLYEPKEPWVSRYSNFASLQKIGSQ